MTSPPHDIEVRVAIVQHSPVFLNLDASLAKAINLLEEAAAEDAQLVVFPETWLPGYPVWLDVAPRVANWDYPPAKAIYRILAENALRLGDKHFNALLEAAGNTGMYLVMGAHERRGATLYNSMLFFDKDGKRFKVHRKLVPTYAERLVWGRGDGSTLEVMPAEFGNLGGLVCWEHWMPLSRAAMHAQGEVIHVAQWPSVEDNHQLASRSYAFEGQCYVLAAGSVLSRDEMMSGMASLGSADPRARELLESIPAGDSDLLLDGGSAVIAPDSSYLAGPAFGEARILYADLDLGRIAEGHLVMDSSGHYTRPDVFQLMVNKRAQEQVTFES
jgi:nitrilase